MATDKECKDVEVEVSFYRSEEKRWRTYSYTIEVCNWTVDEIAEKLADKIIEEWKRKTGVEAKEIIIPYREKVLKALKEAIEISMVRKKSRELQIKISDKERLIEHRILQAILAAKDIVKYGKIRLGINSNTILMFDFDSKRKECLQEAFKIIEFVYQAICKRCPRKALVFETQRGFHLIVGLKLSPQNWRRIYSFILEERPFLCIDYKHIIAALKRGYVTLSVGRRRNFIKVQGDKIIVAKAIYEKYRSVVEDYANYLGAKLEIQG